MDTRSRHLLMEYWDCDPSILDTPSAIEDLARRAAEAAGATVVACVFHQFSPQGVSGVVVVEESHLSVHTWPEHGYAAVDFFTCGAADPDRAHDVLGPGLKAKRSERLWVARGAVGPGRSMSVTGHQQENFEARAANGPDRTP